MVLKQVSFLPAIRAVQRQCSDVSWSGSPPGLELSEYCANFVLKVVQIDENH